jgi:hypothetical protein
MSNKSRAAEQVLMATLPVVYAIGYTDKESGRPILFNVFVQYADGKGALFIDLESNTLTFGKFESDEQYEELVELCESRGGLSLNMQEIKRHLSSH